ncbi:MAG: sugar phosphate isomerase/epimerase [Clostridia bacterium]|nr:sugar phosphate isomerase/epimerase [Clostridia bacterium]
MKIVETTEVLIKHYSEETALDMIKAAGFDGADLSLFDMEQRSRWMGENYKEEAKKLGEYARSIGVPFIQSHAPFSFDFTHRDFETEIFPVIYRSVEIAALAGVKLMVIHPIHHTPYFGHEEELFETNMAFYKRFLPLCEEYGIKICLENMWKTNRDRKVIDHDTCSRAAEFNRYVDTLNAGGGDHFCACLDLGHTVLVGEDPVAMIKAMGSRIQALHIHDNNYHDDSHTLAGCGRMPMEDIFRALKEVGYSGPYTLEADAFFRHMPVELYPTALKFMADTSRYFSKIME